MTSLNTKINFHKPAFLLFSALIVLSIAFYGITKYFPSFSAEFLPNQTYTDLNATPMSNNEFRNNTLDIFRTP